MASIRVKGFTNFLLLLNPVAAAIEYGYIRPAPTAFGLFGIQSSAPRPTRPPSMDEINGELRKRTLPDSIYSLIPSTLCGFINGDFSRSVACASKTCVFIGDGVVASLACSPYDDGEPTIYTRCLDRTEYDSMSTFPSYDTTVCSSRSFPYCGIGTFSGGEYYFFCNPTTLESTESLEYREDWYATGIISITSNPIVLVTGTHIIFTTIKHKTITKINSEDFHDITHSSSTTTSITSSPTHFSDHRLTAPAIAGIGVAIAAVVIGLIVGLGICLFLRSRKQKGGTNQPVAIPTEPSNPQMQQGNPGHGGQIVAPVSSSYPNSQKAFLKDPEHPSPPYTSEPVSIYNPPSSSISSPATPYDFNGRNGNTVLYPYSQNSSATPPPRNEMLPSLLPSIHKPGEVPRISNSYDPATQPTSLILGVGYHGGETGPENLIDNQVHEMGTESASPNNRQGSGTSQGHSYHEISSGFAPPTRQSSGTQSPLSLHPIHETPQAYYNESQAHGVLPSATSRPSGSGAYHEAAHPPREISAGVGDSHPYSNSISSNTGRPPQNDMDPPTSISPALVAPTLRIISGTYEGQQQAQYDIHEAPGTMNYTAYSAEMSPVTRSPLDLYYNNNAQ